MAKKSTKKSTSKVSTGAKNAETVRNDEVNGLVNNPAMDEFTLAFGDEQPVAESLEEDIEDRIYRALSVSAAKVCQAAIMKDGLATDPFPLRKKISLILNNPERVLTGHMGKAVKGMKVSEKTLIARSAPKIIKDRNGMDKVVTESINIWSWLAQTTQVALIGNGKKIKPVSRGMRYVVKTVMGDVVSTYKTENLTFENWLNNLAIFDKLGEDLVTALVSVSSRFKKVPHVVKGHLVASKFTVRIADYVKAQLSGLIKDEWDSVIGK